MPPGVGGAGPPRRGQAAAGCADAGVGRLRGDARQVAVRGRRRDHDQVGPRRCTTVDLAVGQQVGVDDQEGVGWLKASVELALQRPDLGAEFRAYLQGLEL